MPKSKRSRWPQVQRCGSGIYISLFAFCTEYKAPKDLHSLLSSTLCPPGIITANRHSSILALYWTRQYDGSVKHLWDSGRIYRSSIATCSWLGQQNSIASGMMAGFVFVRGSYYQGCTSRHRNSNLHIETLVSLYVATPSFQSSIGIIQDQDRYEAEWSIDNPWYGSSYAPQ